MSENRLIHSDCLSALKELESNSIHAVVTDPPYELGFMGREWDRTGIAYNVDLWREVVRVLKPGGYLLAFGASRTYHRLACAIEDAGFEIRGQIPWIYGQGFPKSLNVSRAIDKELGAERRVISEGKPEKRLIPGATQNQQGWRKNDGRTFTRKIEEPGSEEAKQWEGWGTALKPAHEPICVARKPFAGNVARNVLEHGTGAINVDSCRIETECEGVGRWPADVVLDEAAAEILDEQSGHLKSGRNPSKRSADKHRNVYAGWTGAQCIQSRDFDEGGASRFFYCAKANESERGYNTHPTVKPISLMRWLVRLVCPVGGTLLDCFAGSGSTGVACKLEGFDSILIEREAEYVDIIRRRLADTNPTLELEVA